MSRLAGSVWVMLFFSVPAWAGGSIEVGLDSVAVRDDLLVSLGFGGAGLHLGGGGATALGPGRLSIDADASVSIIGREYGQLGITQAYVLDGRWLIPLSDRVAIGPALLWDGRMSQFSSWDDAHGYWLGSQWLGPAVRIDQSLGDLALQVSGAVALAGMVGRPPTYRWNKQDPMGRPLHWVVGTAQNETFETIATFQAARATVALSPDRDGGRWRTGTDLWLGRAADPELTVNFGAAFWVGRLWGVR